MPLSATAAVGLAAAFDAVWAEPPARIHPVALFGSLVAPLDRAWPAPRLVGVLVALVLPVAAGLASVTAIVAASRVAAWAGQSWLPALGGGPPPGTLAVGAASLVAGVVLTSTTSLRMLVTSARDVVAHADRDLAGARGDLLALAGREASSLSAAQLRSAAVESAAENLSDGLVAPLGGFALGVGLASLAGLPATVVLALGGGLAAWVKAVNTLDSMLGYPEKPVGWAPARLDDLVMVLPARATALVLALAASDPLAPARARVAARAPASPNAGWPMATVATLLGVRLEKPDHYVLDGGAGPPSREQAERGVRLVSRAGWLSFAVVGVVVWP